MELTRDIYLRGAAWATAVQNLSDIFRTRTNYSLFMLSLSLGIMYDKRIKNPDMGEMEDHTPPSVPRNVLQNNDNGKLDFMFQAAILSTRTESYDEEERLRLAFGESTEFNKIGFLLEFANYGVTKLKSMSIWQQSWKAAIWMLMGCRMIWHWMNLPLTTLK